MNRWNLAGIVVLLAGLAACAATTEPNAGSTAAALEQSQKAKKQSGEDRRDGDNHQCGSQAADEDHQSGAQGEDAEDQAADEATDTNQLRVDAGCDQGENDDSDDQSGDQSSEHGESESK